MTEDEYLTSLAEAASSGPWFNDLDAEDGRPEGLITDGRGYCVACVQPHGNIKTVARTGEQFSHDDARYIAAVHPQAVLALLDRLAAAEAERDELRRLLGLAFSGRFSAETERKIEAALEEGKQA